jgi:hypothetical protein
MVMVAPPGAQDVHIWVPFGPEPLVVSRSEVTRPNFRALSLSISEFRLKRS